MRKGSFWEEEKRKQGNVPEVYRWTSRVQEPLGWNVKSFTSSYWKRGFIFPWILSNISNLPILPTTSPRLKLKSHCGELFPTEDWIQIEGNLKVLFLPLTK